MKVFLPTIGVLTLTAVVTACASNTLSQRGAQPGDHVELVVMGTTDVHGWLVPWDYYYGVVDPADVHPVVHAMNHLGYDGSTVGNHEFNYGIEALDRALEDADFPFGCYRSVSSGVPMSPSRD